MICPFCSSSVPDGSVCCPSCGLDLDHGDLHDVSEFVFCEGCGARLGVQERVCPKCGRPAPGILSQNSAASDLAAGKTASFPKLTSEMIADAIPAPEPARVAFSASGDADTTSVLDVDDLAVASLDGVIPARGASHKPLAREAFGDGGDVASPAAFDRPRRGRAIALVLALCLVGGSVWFVAADPMGVMPSFYQSFEQAASDMFPSRQVPLDGDDEDTPAEDGDGTGDAEVSDSTLSEAEAFQRLSSIYAQVVSFQDEIGPVVDTYNGQYLVKDYAQRTDAAQGAYELRKNIQAVLDELDGLTLASDTAYTEDVDHLRQLATWTFNRVDVLCRSWDISLGLPEGERPVDHQDEILAPLREVEKVNGRAVDVISYEENVGAWKPQEK